MALDVDDFGCVPDGRILERASILAGSAELLDPDSILRASDVGKSIAIPGAVDLVATTALVDRKDVDDAAMEAGSDELIATFADPEEDGFLDRPHTGLRITVIGAGPGGAPLVTDVVEVVDRTTLRLAAPAATAVQGTQAVLNNPDRIALSNHARTTVTDVVVDLGDRVLTDASMTVGARGLVSPTALFSLLDDNKVVTVRAAGLLVTTITALDSPTQATLAAPAQHAVVDVRADVWRTDSRPGLELLLADLASRDVEAADIRFSPGVYDFTRIPDLGNPLNAAIGLRGHRNLTLRGAGMGATVLRLLPNQDLGGPDTHVVETLDCTNLTLRDLSVHGSYLTIGAANEQMHGINLNQGSEGIVVQRVEVFQSAGDGIRFLGVAGNRVRKVLVDGCRFVQNKRSGVGFQRACEHVWIRNCYIEMSPPSTDQCLDFEPSNGGSPTDIVIDSNVIVQDLPTTAVALSGFSGDQPLVRVQLANNHIIGGPVFCTDVDQLTVQGNTVVVTDVGRNRIPLHVQRGGKSLLITGNRLVSDDPETEAVISLSEVNDRRVRQTLVANNLCYARANNGVRVISSSDIAVTGNLVVATGACNNGVLVSAQPSDVDGVAIRDNDITVEDGGTWECGILVSSGQDRISELSVVGNSIRGSNEGVRFAGGGFQQTPVVATNRIAADAANALVGLDQLPEQTMVVGGALSHGGAQALTGGGRLLAGLGEPETIVSGNMGDLYQRLGDEPGARLFVKESGDNTTTGWQAK